MAKIAFSKLGLIKNQQVKEWNYNGQIIEVKQYLSLEEKEKLAQNVIQDIVAANEVYFNEYVFKINFEMALVFYYTNISFTDKQKEDLNKLYDLLVGNGFIKELRKQVNCDEVDELELCLYETIKHYFEYRNSIYGIMENMNKDYKNLDLDINNLQDKISNPESLAMVKDILTKMG